MFLYYNSCLYSP